MSSDSSDNETNVGKNTRKRVSKSAVVRGGRGKKANVGNRSRVTRSKNNTRDISNPGNSNTNQQSREMSDESDNDAPEDINLAEISDTISELKERVERYAVFSNTFLMAILKALPASTVDRLRQDARENINSENYTLVHNNLATLESETRRYAEAARTNRSEMETNAGENEAQSSNTQNGTETRDEMRQNPRQNTPRTTMERIEDPRRKKNIIIANMAEGRNEKMQIEGMLYQLECGGTIRAIDGITRLGIARRGRMRPIKVEFNDESAVEFIIKRKRNLEYTEHFCNVYINRDLCKYDREREKENRRQKRRNSNPRARESNPNIGHGELPVRDEQNRNENDRTNANTNETNRERSANEPNENHTQISEEQTENQINEQGSQQNLTTPGSEHEGEVRSEVEENEGERGGNNEERGGGVMANMTEIASATLQGITNIVTNIVTPRRQRTTEPRRNIESGVNAARDGSDTRHMSNGEENANISGNGRGREGERRD